MMFPRMGWNVLSIGEEGSVDLPMVLSRTFDGDHPPPYKLPDNKTRVSYRTATTPGGGSFNEIRFEDSKGGEEMFINATKDLDVLVKDTKGELVHGTMLHVVGRDHSLSVGGAFDVHVDIDQKVTIQGNQTEKVTGDRQKLVDGNETIRIGGTRKLKTGVNAETNTGSRSLRVGAAHISAVLGAVQAQSKLVNQLVGGAVVKATPRKMTEDVGSTVDADTVIGFLPEKAGAAFGKLKKLPGVSKALGKLKTKAGISVQTIGGLKYETGATRKIEVKQAYKETIIAGLDLVTETLTDTATSKFDFDFGNLESKAKNITISSESKVVVSCGSTKITITKSQVKVESPEIQLSKASLLEVSAGGMVRINS
jgi:type VI secretion system secreted protein VgrG